MGGIYWLGYSFNENKFTRLRFFEYIITRSTNNFTPANNSFGIEFFYLEYLYSRELTLTRTIETASEGSRISSSISVRTWGGSSRSYTTSGTIGIGRSRVGKHRNSRCCGNWGSCCSRGNRLHYPSWSRLNGISSLRIRIAGGIAVCGSIATG